MNYHYTREYGPEGCILTGEGPAAGADLSVLLARGRPPLRAALELGAALADILSVAVQDQIVHGDIKPGHVKVDAAGAVSVEDWGPPRQTCRAPEGKPVGPETDVYALGVVLHALLASEPLGALPRDDADAHDESVVHKVMAMDFGDVAVKRWVQDVRQFIVMCMAHTPAERPAALDVANVLAHVSEQCPDPGLQRWAARLVPQISGDAAPRAVPEPPPEERLDGPTFSHGPLQTGMFKPQTRTAPAARGESTAFWTKDKIDAMLAAEDEECEPPAPAPRPGPRPQPRPEPLPEARPAAMPWSSAPPQPAPVPQRAGPEPASPAAGPIAQGPIPGPTQRTGPSAPRPTATGPVAAGPVASGPVIQGPVAAGPVGRSPTPEPAPAKKGGFGKLLVVAVVVLAILGALAVGATGLAYVLFWRTEAPPDAPAAVEPDPPEPPPEEEGDQADEGTPEPKGATPAAPVAEKPAPRAGSGGSTKPSGTPRVTDRSGADASGGSQPTPPPRPSEPAGGGAPSAPAPDEVATGGKYSVRFSAQGQEADLTCGDGQQVTFVNATRLEFEGVVTCMVRIGDARGVVQVREAKTVACIVSGTQVSCGGS